MTKMTDEDVTKWAEMGGRHLRAMALEALMPLHKASPEDVEKNNDICKIYVAGVMAACFEALFIAGLNRKGARVFTDEAMKIGRDMAAEFMAFQIESRRNLH